MRQWLSPERRVADCSERPGARRLGGGGGPVSPEDNKAHGTRIASTLVELLKLLLEVCSRLGPRAPRRLYIYGSPLLHVQHVGAVTAGKK